MLLLMQVWTDWHHDLLLKAKDPECFFLKFSVEYFKL